MNWYERHGINQKRWAAVRRAVFSRDDNCCQSFDKLLGAASVRV